MSRHLGQNLHQVTVNAYIMKNACKISSQVLNFEQVLLNDDGDVDDLPFAIALDE